MCDIGGTLDTTVSYRREKKIYADPERQFGRESRSLKAAYELLQVGDAGFMSKQGSWQLNISARMLGLRPSRRFWRLCPLHAAGRLVGQEHAVCGWRRAAVALPGPGHGVSQSWAGYKCALVLEQVRADAEEAWLRIGGWCGLGTRCDAAF
jgi:hypothetical protein